MKETHKKKLEWLSNRQQRPLFDVQDTVKIADKDIHPPQYVIDTLALGPKNAVLDNFDPKDTLAQIDSLLYQCKRNQVSEDIMNEINVATFKYIKACSEQKTPRNIKMTKRYLKDNKLLAVPFDKGVGMCVMRKETYEKKLMDILRLSQLQKWVKPRKNSKDLIVKEEERINDELSQLLRDGAISEELRGELKSKGGQPP